MPALYFFFTKARIQDQFQKVLKLRAQRLPSRKKCRTMIIPIVNGKPKHLRVDPIVCAVLQGTGCSTATDPG